jgi:hypothetical protein
MNELNYLLLVCTYLHTYNTTFSYATHDAVDVKSRAKQLSRQQQAGAALIYDTLYPLLEHIYDI